MQYDEEKMQIAEETFSQLGEQLLNARKRLNKAGLGGATSKYIGSIDSMTNTCDVMSQYLTMFKLMNKKSDDCEDAKTQVEKLRTALLDKRQEYHSKAEECHAVGDSAGVSFNAAMASDIFELLQGERIL